MTSSYDTIIVGSGIGGATLAQELTKAGERVLLLEKGGNHRILGNHVAVMRIADKKGFRSTKEGMMVASGITHGGSSVISCGTAFRPPADLFQDRGINLERELDEIEKEIGVTTLPDELIGPGTLNLLEAGNRLGQEWIHLPKMVDTTKCIPQCSACMLGCKKKAKYTARELIEKAKMQGLEIQKKKVDHVVLEGTKAVGVKPAQGHTITADRIIVSAGGVHSPIILQKSGVKGAGQRFFMDPLIFTYGLAPEKELSTIREMPMTVGTYKYYGEGILQSPVVDPWGLYLITFGLQRNLRNILKFRHYRRLMGVMTKTQDEKNGVLSTNRWGISISKKLTTQDVHCIERGQSLAKEVLIEAGSKPKDIFSTPVRGAHPGGTNSIGEVVNPDLEVLGHQNLYVCDASILPRSLGAPLVITIMAFAKRLAQHLQ